MNLVTVEKPADIGEYTTKTTLTTIGKIHLVCRYDECKKCLKKNLVTAALLGLEVSCTHGARRLIVRAGTGWSFRQCQENLKELCGLDVSYNTVRELCRQETPKMKKWYRDCRENHKEFQKASDDIEFTADGTCVNTTEGWKEVKVGIFSKRTPGNPAYPDQWDTRHLPKPSPVIAFAAVEEKDKFRASWGQWKRRLCKQGEEISVLADCASWIMEYHG